MRQALILCKGEEAGVLSQKDDGSFHFRYLDDWFENPLKPSVSLTLPKSKQEYFNKNLFACFYNILPEGDNRSTIAYYERLDDHDDFGLLMTIARFDSIGAITVRKIEP